MKGKAHIPLAILAVSLIMVGCGKDRNAVQTSVRSQGRLQAAKTAGHANRVLFGLWKISISADRTSAQVTPYRTGAMHVNAVRFLEVWPCTNCLLVQNIVPLPGNMLQLDVKLNHPFPGKPKLTAFDVRGVFITGSDYKFPVSGRRIAYGDGLPRLMNADGYTSLFNPTEFPSDGPPALSYYPGKLATGGDLTATLNPYVSYNWNRERRIMPAGLSDERRLQLCWPPGAKEFGYAIDASWVFVQGDITGVPSDFPPEANCIEAYMIDVGIGPGLHPSAGGMAEISVDVFDHQGLETVSAVSVEAPELFAGGMLLDYAADMGNGSWRFSGTIVNETGLQEGYFLLLARVRDVFHDENLGEVDGWQVVRVPVATPLGWARTWGAGGGDLGLGVAADIAGNLHVVGQFSSTVDFNPGDGTEYHYSHGGTDVYVSKFDPSGSFLWARSWGGAAYDYGLGVAVDGSGNVSVTGKFSETVDFDPWGDTHDYHSAHGIEGYPDAFLSSFDASGSYRWARTWGGGKGDWGKDVAVDGSGNTYVTGGFNVDSTPVDFDPGTATDYHESNGGSDIYLSKFDSMGHFQWARTWGGSNIFEYGMGVASDASGHVYVTGVFKAEVDFDPGPGVDIHKSAGGADAFLSKFDSSGDFQWACTWGGPSGEEGKGVDVDEAGNVYVTGSYGGTADFDPGPGIHSHTAGGSTDSFLSKFDSSGAFQHAVTWGGTGVDNGFTSPWGVAVSGSGDACVAGWFTATTDFDPGDGFDVHGEQGDGDAFLVKFASSGAFEWARTWGEGYGQEEGRGIAVDSAGNVFVTGNYGYTVDFHPGPGTEFHTSNGLQDAYLVKFAPDGNW